MRVGSGGVPGVGTHSHMTKEIYYLPANREHSVIAWVGIKRGDSYIEFSNPAIKSQPDRKRIKKNSRLMDCIDCHNRPAHDFIPFERLLDAAITRQQIPQDLPYIKRESMNAVGEIGKDDFTQAGYNKTVDRIGRIEDYYRTSYPGIYGKQQAKVRSVVSEVKRVYKATVFPLMNVGPETYPNWRTHTGCFRCHGTIVPKGGVEPVSQDCNLCHSMPVEGGMPSVVPDTGASPT
jgi:hypothetical protein